MCGCHLLLQLYSVKVVCIANLQQAPRLSNHGSEIIGTWSYDNATTVHLACCIKWQVHAQLMVGLCGWKLTTKLWLHYQCELWKEYKHNSEEDKD